MKIELSQTHLSWIVGLFIDFKYQSINCYRLILIAIDCHRLLILLI